MAVSRPHGKSLRMEPISRKSEQRAGTILEHLDPAMPEAQTTLDYTISSAKKFLFLFRPFWVVFSVSCNKNNNRYMSLKDELRKCAKRRVPLVGSSYRFSEHALSMTALFSFFQSMVIHPKRLSQTLVKFSLKACL